MKRRTVASGIFFTASICIAVTVSMLLFEGAALKSYALTDTDCRVCHTGGLYPTVAERHHSLYVPVDFECSVCHNATPLSCTECHSSAGHQADHDKTDIPVQECSTCHVANVYDEHVTNRAIDCSLCHQSTRQEVLDAIDTGSGPAGQTVLCGACHVNAGMHEADHDNTLVDSTECTQCHSDNVFLEHVVNRGWPCATCHQGETLTLDPALVMQVVTDASGPANPATTAYCTSCHGPDAGLHAAAHDQGLFTENPSGQNCTRCHAAMNSPVDPNQADLVTEHVTNRGFLCSTCHERTDHVFDAINKGRDPSNLPVYCVDCHTDPTSGQGKGHLPVSAEPWSECSWCHTIDVFGIPEHSMHQAAAQDIQQDCAVCHVPDGTRPACILCHSLDQTVWDPLPVNRTAPNNSLNIIGPGTEDHDRHTSGIDCSYCHVSGIPGSEPLPAPYSECSKCHNSTGPGTDIAYGSTVHTINHTQGAEAAGQGCAYCHSPTPACTDCHEIAGPNTIRHDTHTDTLQYTCTECHINGIAGSEPLPEPYDQCTKCHNPTGPGSDIVYGSLIHTSNHIPGGEATPQSCDLCHGPTAPAPSCTTCHEIAGPATFSHDVHTNTQKIACAECHVSGYPGDTPLPTPYNECSICHDGSGNTINIMYGQPGHYTHMTQANNDCSLCHSPQPDCSACHAPGHPPIPAPYNECSTCHNGTGTSINIMYGQPGHNAHMTAANNNCAACHNDQPDCGSCHAPGHQPVPAPFNECDQCHNTLQPGAITHDTHRAQASQDCTVCHTAQATCSSCHVPSHPPVPAPYDTCDQCHMTLQPGQTTHNTHRLQADQNCATCHTAQPDCSQCHTGTTHEPIPAPYNDCENCHTTLQPGQLTHEAHKAAATIGGIVDCAACHSPQTDCSSCHNSQPHGPIPAPYNDCVSCHTTIAYGQAVHNSHISAAGNNCTACHNNQPDCSACHAPGHPAIPAPYNTCDQCHTTLQPGQATHDTHRLQASQDCAICHTEQPDCAACHTGTLHEPVPEQYNACDQCHTTLQPGQLTHDAHKAAATTGGMVDCAACHSAQATCATCHSPGHPAIPAPYNTCDQCHTTLQPGQTTHDTHRLQANHDCATCHNAQPDCSACHTGTLHEPVPAPYNACDDCHTAIQPGSVTHNAHKAAATTAGIADCAVCHTSSPAPNCGQCHTAGDHSAAHDNAGVPSTGCTNCHDANVVVEHVDNRGFACTTCHDSTDPNVSGAITTGKAGTTVTCYDCHGQNNHHATAEAQSGNCAHCHTDPRPLDNDPQQLSCRQCHIDNNGFVQTSAPAPNHAFNTNGNIQDFGACFDCHAPVPYHGKPTQTPECWKTLPSSPYYDSTLAPGKGSFNIFSREMQYTNDVWEGTQYENLADQYCAPTSRSDWWNPAISFNWYSIDYQGQAMDVPVFDQGGAVPSHTHSMINTVGNCGDCHTVGTVVPVTHINNCQACHLSDNVTVQNVISMGRAGNTVDCFDCHGSQDHVSAHDMTELTEPGCAECHVPNVFTEHVANRTLSCSNCHSSSDPNVQNAIVNGMNGTPVPCQDCHGSNAGDHLAAHDSVGVPSTGCTNCHDGNVVTEHVSNRGFVCADCHDNSAYDSVINAGQNGTFVDCYDCHGTNTHHTTAESQSGNCTYCHADPRLDIDPNAPTGQLACRECHGTNKHNNGGPIQDFGACFACHQPTPYHAKPTSEPNDCTSTTPGKGTFNLFFDDWGGQDGGRMGGHRGERNENCDGRESDFQNPAISFNMVTITAELSDNQTYSVPTFGSTGGGGGGGDTGGGGTGGDVDPNGTIIEAEEYDIFGNNWDVRNDYSSASGSYLYATTNSTSATSGQPAEYELNFTETGTYYISFLMNDNGSSGDNSLWYGVDGSMAGNITSPGSNSNWNWASTPHNTGPNPARITITSTGTHTILIWARENGLRLDQFHLVRDGGSSGGGDGGGSQDDSLTITRARYDNRRVEVRAENSLGDNATLSVIYDGNSYEMNWDSGNDRWEIEISSYSCQDSTIEVVSSAGGSDSSSVDNCSSSRSWGGH